MNAAATLQPFEKGKLSYQSATDKTVPTHVSPVLQNKDAIAFYKFS